MPVRVSTSDVVALRLHAHHLDERLDAGGLLRAAGRCAVQNSPPGSALLALNARVAGVTGERLAEAVEQDRTLLQTWCMRGAPFFFPAVDAPVFTTGVMPPTEQGMRRLLLGVVPALARLDLSLGEAVALCRNEIRGVLACRRLAIGELGAQVAARVARRLSDAQRAVWEQEGPWAAGQPLGEGVVHFCVRILTLEGVLCFAGRTVNTAPFVLVEEWLGHALPHVEPDVARAELVRRYLRAYGPSTRGDFAAWVGVGSDDSHSWWSLVEGELMEVEVEARGRTWLLSGERDALLSAPTPTGVRLLPPRDPYTQLRDRGTIVDAQYHRAVWRPVGEPGVVLAAGRVVGTWRARTKGPTTTVTVTPFSTLVAHDAERLREEAAQLAAVKGSSGLQLEMAGG